MRIILLSALLTTSIFAQHRGGGAPAARARSASPAILRPAPVARPPIAPRPYYPRTVGVPYPVFIGGGYYGGYPAASGYDYGYAGPAPAAYVNPDYQPDTTNPSIVDYSNTPSPEPAANTDENGLRDDEPTIFLIALTDHTVVAAIAYWVDGDTLNWVSRDAKQNRMSLSLVDRDFSKQLNDERHVEFKLPPAQ
jgi:hypothetical protein